MVGEAIFLEEEERKIKFFIQKDLELQIVEKLHYQIIEHGGRVETKVPIQGFVLIDPKSSEGRRLIDCWETSERPLRNFVPHTFVTACVEARKLIPQVFRKSGVSLKFHIHPSISDEGVIDALCSRIWHSGGHPLATESEADVIIADENMAKFHALVNRFDHYHNKYVEGIYWVKQCVESGVYQNTPVTKKNLGGRIPGVKRTEFTPEDDTCLVKYIACRLPDAGMRGRTGNKLYQDLCSQPGLYPWAERHPWQSWRERYKNNSARFSKAIALYLETHPISSGGKGLHGFVRVSSSSSKSQSNQRNAMQSKSPEQVLQEPYINDTNDAWGSQWPVKMGGGGPPPWGKGKRKVEHDIIQISSKRKKDQTDHNKEEAESSQRIHNALSEMLSTGALHKTSPDVTRSGLERAAADEEANAINGVLSISRVCTGAGETVDSIDPVLSTPRARTATSEAAEIIEAAPPGDTPRAGSRSPTDNNEVNKALDDTSADVRSEGDDIGPETQALLDANRAMITDTRRSPEAAPSIPRADRPRRPANTELLVKSRSAMIGNIDAEAKLALVDIACGCRFLLDEVFEEYEELNRDLDATRTYFKENRALINERKSMRGDRQL